MKITNIFDIFKRGFNNEPWYLIFAVTARCNQKCSMCFYWSETSNSDISKELKLSEIAIIAPQFDNLYQLTLTGGEPLLRTDCLKIADIFAKTTPVKRITLTTNGMLPEKIDEFITGFCPENKNIVLSLNLSIDGLEKTHDEIRGVKGAFNNFLSSYELIKKLKNKYENLDSATATTLSKINIDEMYDLIDFIDDNLDITSHGIMLTRGDIRNPEISEIPFEKINEILSYHQKKVLKKMIFPSSAIYRTYQKRRIASIKTGKMLDPCLAGRKLLILNEKGELSPCELLEPLRKQGFFKPPDGSDFRFGNLRNYNYHLKEILSSEKALKINEFIKKNNCGCTFECAMINNFALNPANYFRIPLNIS
jgi:MoaA/NifB/PqqE/SkfB family radical SAM enzyme